jgi:DNA polymerase-1
MDKKYTYVPSFGSTSAPYIIVGEQPGKTEVLDGQPFVGPAGYELRDDMRLAGINPQECYFTNVIKDLDLPLSHYIEIKSKKNPIIKPDGEEYLKILAQEITSCRGRIIIALGNIALFALSDRVGITKWRGSVLEPTLISGKLLIPSLHPATIIPPKNVYKNKRLLIYDLKRARKIREQGWDPLQRNIKIRPSFEECLKFIDLCFQMGLRGTPIAYDIETDMNSYEMTCISLAYSPLNGISIPLIFERGDYFTPPQELTILRALAQLIEHPEIKKVGQNLIFDSAFMLKKYGIKASNLHDTMIAQKTLLPDYPVGLHFICSMYTDLPYYKDDGKYWIKAQGTFEQGWDYNTKDSLVCAEAYPKQLADLRNQVNQCTYERKRKTIPPYTYMMDHGIKINVASMKQAYDNMQLLIEEKQQKLNKLCGFDLNPNSFKQVAAYFYDKLKFPHYKGKSGNVTTDEKALKRVSRYALQHKKSGRDEARLVLEIRGLVKGASTFLNINKVDSDGRMRCSYNPSGTRFSRSSSSENIFGKGNNLQNQPHRVLSHFLADDNYIFYGPDLSQAENRIVAYEGRITQMIDCFETKKDVHSLTAYLILAVLLGRDRALAMNPKKDLSFIGDGKKTWRDWGKKANHSLNYDESYKTFALINEIPEKQAKLIIDAYHSSYPGVRKGYHKYVENQIRQTRHLVNLMGRKTLFTDKMGDELFKAGYACIPQGTVGDIIDERGMNFIYYHQDPIFKPVQLKLQVHDMIGFQIPSPYHPTTPICWRTHAAILRAVKTSLETPLYTHYGRKFVIPVDFHMGLTLNKGEGIDLKQISPTELENGYQEVCSKLKRYPMVIR